MRPGPRRACAIAKPVAFAADQVRRRHPHVVERDLGVAAVVAVVVAEHGQRTHDPHARGVARHEDHRLLAVPFGIGIGLAHHDEDRGIRVHRSRRPPLAAGDHVLVAVAADAGADVGRVGGGDVGLGHAERRADLGAQQRREPPLLLLRRAEVGEHLHVAGVGCGAVERDRGQARAPPGDLGERRVLEVGQTRALGRRAGRGSTGRARGPAPAARARSAACPTRRASRPAAPSSTGSAGMHMLVEECAHARRSVRRVVSSCAKSSQRLPSPVAEPSPASGSTSAPMRSKPSPTVSPAW